MNQHAINELLNVLKPALKNRKKAQAILESKILVVVWPVEHVFRAANERGLALTREEALTILQHFRFTYDSQLGLRWSDFTEYMEEHVLGRKLSQAELNRFIKKDIITIHKS